MCGLPSNTLSGQAFISGPSGYVRDKVFGRGTSQKMVDHLDKRHKSVFGSTGESIGIAPGSVPGPNKKSGNIDFAEERRKKKLAAGEAERDRIYRSLGQTNAPQSSILGS